MKEMSQFQALLYVIVRCVLLVVKYVALGAVAYQLFYRLFFHQKIQFWCVVWYAVVLFSMTMFVAGAASIVLDLARGKFPSYDALIMVCISAYMWYALRSS
jgi:hypothetical protein